MLLPNGEGAVVDISTCTFSLFFQPIPNIRREAFEIEAKLDGYMKPFQIHSVPDEAPFELPRISATTENGHSSLNIAAQSAQVLSRYDEAFSKDFAKSLNYSKSKALELYAALTTMPAIQLHFAGLAVQLLMSASEIGSSPVKFISDTYLKVSSKLPMSDASAKLVYKVGNDLYLNLEVQKIVLTDPLSINIGPDGISVVKKLQSNNEEMLAISIDFNNRLAFNEGRILGCDENTIESFYGRIQAFLECGFDVLLKNGEVKF